LFFPMAKPPSYCSFRYHQERMYIFNAVFLTESHCGIWKILYSPFWTGFPFENSPI